MAGEFPPRGSGEAGRHESAPSSIWQHPEDLDGRWDWTSGKILLGQDGRGRLIAEPDRTGMPGKGDDRHIVTKAGNRAGKSTRVLVPNLRRYPGSAVVIDPKGELAKATADARRAMGQDVHILDPFGLLGGTSASHNPLDELGDDLIDPVAANAAQLADAMLIANERDPHWTDAGRNLLRGLALHLRASTSMPSSMRELRRLINGTAPELDDAFAAMADSDAYDGVVRNTGRAFLGKAENSSRELQGILSTVQEQTAPLDDVLGITDRSDFRLSALKERRMTVYLVLPGLRMGTHFRWLRLFIQQALIAMERTPSGPDAMPVLFILEEFATLGYMRAIETAAGFMAGFGVRLWTVLQDLTQLKTHYPKSWETFLGNAGIIMAFGNVDLTTTRHLSEMLGQTVVVERKTGFASSSQRLHGDDGSRTDLRSVPLLAANEIAMHFARQTGRQLVIVPGEAPLYLELLGRDA